jgi:hypothetical protein
MKDFRGMKRQRSRNRKPSGNQNNPNRAYESNGPEGTKVRGNAQTIYEKYQQLARDANSSGDRVLAENHLQHAEHYFRLIRQMQPTRPVSEFVQRDPFSNGYDDFDDDVEMMDGGENEAEAIVPGDGDQPSVEDREARDNGRNRDRFDRNDRNRDRNDRNDRNRDRNDRNRDNGRDNGTRDNGRDNTRGDRQPYEPREPREPRVFEPRAETRVETRAETEEPLGEFDGRRESRRERYERRRQQRLSEQEQNLNAPASPGFIASTEPLGVASASRPAPEPVSEQPAIRDDLPAFLNRPTPVAASPVAEEVSAEEPAKPKRGRPKRKTEAATEEA